MKKFSKKSVSSPERLTAAQARAIPIEDSLVESVLREMYKGIREVASRGGSEVRWRNGSFSDGVRKTVRRRLEDDGYHIQGNMDHFIWVISWKELW